MLKLDHLTLRVKDFRVARDWYRSVLGMKVEFELPERGVAAMQDDTGFTLFVEESDQRKELWGYGAELADPDGNLARLWDEQSMRASESAPEI